MGTYLQQFLESIQTLPCDLKRNLILMRQLDGKVNDIMKSIDSHSDDYINAAHELTPNLKCEKYDEIMKLYDMAQARADDKKELAHQTYDIIDKHIRRLDSELAKFDQIDDNIKDISSQNINNKKKGLKKMKEKYTEIPIKQVNIDTEKNVRSKNSGPNYDFANKNCILSKSDLSDMFIDPNEPRYCICNQVSFGNMVGCDDSDCHLEWFHFDCVNITAKPKGKWFCPDCITKKKNKQA